MTTVEAKRMTFWSKVGKFLSNGVVWSTNKHLLLRTRARAVVSAVFFESQN